MVQIFTVFQLFLQVFATIWEIFTITARVLPFGVQQRVTLNLGHIILIWITTPNMYAIIVQFLKTALFPFVASRTPTRGAPAPRTICRRTSHSARDPGELRGGLWIGLKGNLNAFFYRMQKALRVQEKRRPGSKLGVESLEMRHPTAFPVFKPKGL